MLNNLKNTNMKKFYFLFIILISTASFGQTSDLYFSMYGEGGGSNKFLEIYNGTGADVDLSIYSIELYSNGAAADNPNNTEALTGILTDGDVYVIYNASAVDAIKNGGDLSSSVTYFNGDDAVALLKNDAVIDVIGEIGNDPGSSWAVGSTSGGTANHTLVRKFAICDPNATNLDSFGTDDATSEWIVYSSDAEFGQIGSHAACTADPTLSITAPTDGNEFAPGTTSVDVSVSVINFSVANGTGDGHIHWTVQLNSDAPVAQPMKYDVANESVDVVNGQSYTIIMELVDNSHTAITPAVSQTITFSVLDACVNNIGDIIITEIMQDPSAVADDDGEYFEVYNTTGSPIDINGWEMTDNGSNSHTIGSSLVVPANGYAVLGNNADSPTNGGVTVNYEYSSYTLGNGSDAIILTCSGTVIDEVAWDGGANFPDPTGASMELSTDKYNSTDNDDGANWAESLDTYGDGDLGTPGSANSSSSTNPTLLISDGPANGSSVVDSPELGDNATIDFTTTNFIMSNDSGSCVSDSSGEGYIKWDVKNTGTNNIVDSGCIFTSNGPPEYPVAALSTGNTYLLTARLVDNNGDAFIPDVTYTLTLTIASYTDVADLATLRASTVSDEIFYRVTGEVINTYSRGTRNQKYFQDATGGILVDDEDFQVGSVYAEGDGVENIRGHLSTVSGVLQFIPTEADWGSATSTANDITPEVVTVSTLLSSWGSYESELVRINGVTFTDAGGSFSSSTSYDISDSSTMTFRTNFSEANYIGGVIPSGSNDIIVLVGEYFGTPQVTAKSMNDLTLSIGRTEIEGFAIYPNPVSNGEFSIRTNGGVSKSVQIFDMLGKQVYSKEVQANENVKISNLNTGIYILKVQEEGRLATRKLVVH
jgi:hypothetical protein